MRPIDKSNKLPSSSYPNCEENVSLFTGSPDLLHKTSWVDASVALRQIRKGKALGNKATLMVRSKFQRYLHDIGCFIQRNPGTVLFVGLLALLSLTVGLKSAKIETNIDKLWVEVGGRLGKEIEYIKETLGDGFGNTNQLIIQTPSNENSNVLHPNALLLHLEAIKVGTQVTVDMFEVTWRLKDVCYSLSIPAFEEQLVDEALEKLIPCAIITPLDCFWEGSKLLGPEDDIRLPVMNLNLKWENFNPQSLLELAKMSEFASWESNNRFPFETFENLMSRAGISTAYQRRPCLNPKDEDCPASAPNKNSREPDVGFELTGGCYGFATKWMHWPEELIVGGIKKNKTGHIVKASALQSIIQLMAEQDMFTYWQNHYKVHNIDWSVEKARLVLEAWQRKFAQEVQKYIKDNSIADYEIEQFTNVALLDIMKNFSKPNVIHLLIGYCVMLMFAASSLFNVKDCVYSQSSLGIFGVLLIALSIASGLGFCSLIGLPFNATTTQIIPFLALGLGTATLFLLMDTYAKNLNQDTQSQNVIAETLQQIGYSIILNAFCISCSFGAAAIIPIPALRHFVAQTAILITFITLSLLIIYPAVMTLDLQRRRLLRYDLLCCFKVKSSSIHHHNHRHYQHHLHHSKRIQRETRSSFSIRDCQKEIGEDGKKFSMKTASNSFDSVDKSCKILSKSRPNSAKKDKKNISSPFIPVKSLQTQSSLGYIGDIEAGSENEIDEELIETGILEKLTLNYFVATIYTPLLEKRLFKLCVIILCFVALLVCLSGWPQVKDGLDLTDIVPRDTSEYRFLDKQKRFFGVYNIYAVTQGNFEYPTNQLLLLEYHSAFTRVSKIIKNDDGGLPEFWLTMFRDWLIALQSAFDVDWRNGSITQERWYPNASAEGILAYKLLVQTGRVDNPVDKSLVTRVRLVDERGIINSKAFYNYLTAWVSNDAIAYSASQANFHPEPRQWIHIASDYELKIPKSQPLVYAQIPFYLTNMDSTEEITSTIKEIRQICKNYEDKGLPNFPTGYPFTYWEQYIRLRFFLTSALVVVFAIIFITICIILFNCWAASMLVIVLALNCVQTFGLMGLLDIKLSAVPAVILIISVGKGNNILIHLLLSFLTSIGRRDHRVISALHHIFSPLVLGEISTLLGIGMLAFSEFDFIIRDFFFVFFGVIVISTWNGLVLFPILLSLVGPPAEVIPIEHENRISTPSPPASPIVKKKHRPAPFIRRTYPRVQSEISLSTISEEPPSYQSSHEIVVAPELVVETTTVTNTTPQHILTQTTSSNLTSDKLSGTSSASSSDRDSPETPLSRESPASASDSGASTLSRSSSTTTTIYPPPGNLYPYQQQTVTTKVTTTAKLKVELHAPYLDRDYSSTNRNKTKDRRPSRS